MKYYRLSCLDENHESRPYVRFIIWNDEDQWLKIELTEVGITNASHLPEFLKRTYTPIDWYENRFKSADFITQNTNIWKIEEITKKEAFAEML